MHIEAPGDDKPVVVVDRMSFNYHDCDYGVKDVHFTLHPGDRVLLIGHNGCGKSTLLSLIGGRRKATSGSITVLGVDAFEETGLNHRVALLGPPWPPEAYFANTVESVASPTPNVRRKEAIATHLHLPLSALVDRMSSGEKRRVQILHGMLHEAEVLLLDECSTDIDVAERKTVLDLVKRECMDVRSTIGLDMPDSGVAADVRGHVRKQRACCIYATHILDGVEGWATHVALMDNQRIIDFRPIEEVTADGYGLPKSVLAEAPNSTKTVDGRGGTHFDSRAALLARRQQDDDDNDNCNLPNSLQVSSLEQYAHAFVSRNRSRERRYRFYVSPDLGPDVRTDYRDQNASPSGAVCRTQANYFDHNENKAGLLCGNRYSEDYIIRCRAMNIALAHSGQSRGNIFKNAAVDIKRGSRTLLVGCNGSGKSTLLNIWGGKRVYLQPKSHRGPDSLIIPQGQVQIPTVTVGADGSEVAMPAGMYLNGVEMYSDMRVMVSNTVYGGDWWTRVPGGEMRVWDLVHQPMTARAFEISNLLQIDWSWDVRYLSAGEQKRVQLLLMMQYDKPLVILDEATADLDVDQRHELLKFLFLESVTKGTTVVYTTHIFEGLSGWASEIIVLDRTAQGVHTVIPLTTFAESEDPCLFSRLTDTLVQLKAGEHFSLRDKTPPRVC